MKKAIFFVVLIIGIILLSPPLFAQSFNFSDIESLKNEFLRGGSISIPTGSSSSSSGKTTSTSYTTKTTTQKTVKELRQGVNFPSAPDLVSRSDVAFIDPDTYLLGPGDVLRVVIYGGVNQEITDAVQPDGTFFFPPAKPIYIKGKTISQAQNKIYYALSQYYKNFNVKVQMTQLRRFEVKILGEVQSQGTFITTPVVGCCDAIGLAGGLSDKASLRNVSLRDKNNKEIRKIDLFKWYYLGDKSQNHPLEPNMIIYVPLYQDRIQAMGSFKRTGEFEMVPGERLLDLVKMLEPDTEAVISDTRISRITDEGKVEIIPADLTRIEANPADSQNILLQKGDTLFIPELSVFQKKIRVVGEISNQDFFTPTTSKLTGDVEFIKQGLYRLKEGERVRDVISSLGGVTVKADMDKTRIERPMPDGSVKIIKFNLRKLIYEQDESQNLALEAGDSLIVPSIPDAVYLVGEVRRPGVYQYNTGNKLKEYIALAGGTTNYARLKQVRIISNINDEKAGIRTIDLRSIMTGNQMEDFELRPGDVVFIPRADVANWRDVLSIMTDLMVIKRLFNF